MRYTHSPTVARDRRFARFYDLEYRGYADDIDFYVQYAAALDPDNTLPVLELGSGTGRISFALAKAGFKVVGVDSSKGMQELSTASADELGLLGQVTLTRSDMRTLEGVDNGPFNLAFCALNTFSYLTTTADQLAMLRAVHSRLVQHGILILDLTPPFPYLLPPSEGEVVYQGSYNDGKGGILHKFITGHADHSTQLHHVTIFYDREYPDGSTNRLTQTLSLRWTSRYEMELLLQVAGYDLERIYGSYELEEYGPDSERMIFMART